MTWLFIVGGDEDKFTGEVGLQFSYFKKAVCVWPSNKGQIIIIIIILCATLDNNKCVV